MPLRVSLEPTASSPAGSTAAASASTRGRKSGQGIEHGGDEHVAGDAADRVEMDVRIASGGADGPARRRGPRGSPRPRGSPWRAMLAAIAASTDGDDLDAGDAPLLGVEAGGVELDAADAHRLQLHLGLPLVDLGERLRGQRRQEPLGPELDQPRLRLAEFRRAEPLRARARR